MYCFVQFLHWGGAFDGNHGVLTVYISLNNYNYDKYVKKVFSGSKINGGLNNSDNNIYFRRIMFLKKGDLVQPKFHTYGTVNMGDAGSIQIKLANFIVSKIL